APAEYTVETSHALWTFGADGVTRRFVDKATGTDYLAKPAPFARVLKDGAWRPATSANYEHGRLVLAFDGARAVLRVTPRPEHFEVEVLDFEGAGVTELAFMEIPLSLKGTIEEPFACTLLALNLETNSPKIPGPNDALEAHAYARLGFQGARVAVVAAPMARFRDILKDVVQSAGPDIPKSDIGGPWALDSDAGRGSYLFDFGKLTEQTVDDWIATVQALGMNQVDFHTGSSLRFGDYEPNPELFPNGRASLKAVIDKLHAAGIAAGLHTYAFFIAKDTPYVTPIPDPRLGKDVTFTLAADLPAEATDVPVVETTEKMSTLTGFFVQNSVTLQIDDELIIYKQVKKDAPFAFTECERGAYGTKVAAHAKGAPVHHLREMFGLFTPDPDSTLLTEIAANTADVYNECGFDMIYQDALDGSSVLAGGEWAWYYGSKFVFDIAKRLDKPALFEMSTFHHHLWYVRARMGAWDCSQRAHNRNLDVHLAANRQSANMLLPMNLGWYTVKTWEDGPFATQGDPTFPEDIEYLLGKCLGADMGFSLMGVNPETIKEIPAYQRLAPIFKDYETLRHSKTVPESIKARLRTPRESFVLSKDAQGAPAFAPADYLKHKVTGLDNGTSRWTVTNRFAPQPPRVRIEALMLVEPADAPGGIVAEDFQAEGLKTTAAENVASAFAPEASPEGAPEASGPWLRYSATNNAPAPALAWTRLQRTYEPPKNLANNQGLGVWVKGDGQGALLNVQLRSPEHTLYGGFGDHYITLDFNDWRYFELVEPDSDRIEDYRWPYGAGYGIYREFVDYSQVHSLSLWLNNLPAQKETACVVGAVRALPLVKGKVARPGLRFGGATAAFPVELETGQYLECDATGQAIVYGPKGERLREVKVEGAWPALAAGENLIEFTSEPAGDNRPRVRITVSTQGDPIAP
ncbi:MAG: hypothetical protein RBU21_23170, partial [FCB group bacterium]|nr:hypothetical protein [FCB group bacterium]